MKYPIYTPTISPYTKSVLTAVDSGWISSQGEFIENTSTLLKNIIKTQYVLLTNNGTSATHLLYIALRFKYPHIKKIYVPNNVFVAVWNCALYEYSKDMIEVLEMDDTTLNMNVNEDYILSLEPDSAVVIVHNIGNVVNVPRLKRIRPDLIFVEDNCEAFLEEYEGKYTGTESLCSAVSFFANKIVTSGEGGAFFTNDKDVYDFIYKTCHHGMSGERYIYETLGRNYRMTNIQAAILYDQLLDIDTILAKKKGVRQTYVDMLKETHVEVVSNGLWMFVIRIPGSNYIKFYTHMLDNGIDTRPMFYSIDTHTHLKNIQYPNTISHCEYAMIPSSPSLTNDDQVFIVEKIKDYIKEWKL
jgi:perosamine synthetase